MRKGFAPILVVLGLISILVIVFFGLKYYVKTHSIPIDENTPILAQEQTLPPETSPIPFDETASWKTYRNEKLGLSFKYPQSLELGEGNNKISFNNYKEIGLSPTETARSDMADIAIHIQIEIEPVDSQITLEEYLDKKYPAEDEKWEFSSLQKQRSTGIMRDIRIGAEAGFISEEGMLWENIQRTAWVKRDSQIVTFTATGCCDTGSEPSEIAEKTFDQILSTFKFLD